MKVRWFTSAHLIMLSLALFFRPATAPATTVGTLTAKATPVPVLNTGVGSVATGELLSSGQWVAAQFTLTDPTAITDVQGYAESFGTSGAVNIVIWTNNNSDPTYPVPGTAIWTQSYTLTAPGSTGAWIDFKNYLAVLAPGTYWVAFEGAKGSTVSVGMGVAATPAESSAFFDGGINTWINMYFGTNHSTNYPAVMLSGYDLGTDSGAPLITSGTFARTVGQGSIFNSPCGQNLGPYGNIGQADTLQWNICPGVYSASAYGTITANPKTSQGNILEAGAYSATGPNGSTGAARGIVFSTYLNTTGKDIPNVQANAALSGLIAGAGSNSPVTVSAAVYVFDTAAFTSYIDSVVPTQYPTLGWLLLGGDQVTAGQGSYYEPNLGLLFPSYVDDSWDNNSQFEVCNGTNCAQGYEVSTAGFDLPANALFTVMFNVTAASEGANGAQTTAIGDFLSTLEADPQYFFTDGNTSVNNGLGNVIAGIAGPLTVALPDTPGSISLSPSTQSTAVGSTTVVTATVTDASHNPVPDAIVRFSITLGPHAGFTLPVGTGDGNVAPLGVATFTYTDTLGTGGTDSISATVGGISAATPAQVTWTTPGPLFNIALSPASTSISLGNGQTYDATGTDFFGNSVGDVTSQLTFTISPEGACVGAVCTPTATGMHTVTGTGSNPVVGTITGTATLNVTSSSSTPMTITASSTTMVYGSTPPTPTAEYTYGNVTLSSAPPNGVTPPTCTTSATSTTPVGTDTGANTCLGASGSNYSITYAAGNVTVSGEPVTITATNTTMTYGGTAPTPSALYTYGSVTLSATAPAGLTAPSCVTSATSSTPVGTDTGANTCSGGSGSNYSITYAAGNVTVSAEPVTITASNTSMAYGSTPPTPAPEYTYGSVTLSATAPAGLTAPSCVTSATSSTPVGTDTGANTCSGASGSNYSVTYALGNATVNAEPVTITASNTSITYGSTPPTPTPEYTYGSVTLSATAPAGLTGTTCGTTATSSTPVGTDTGANTCSGASGSNYSVSYAAGNVTVSGEPVRITAINTTMTYGGTAPTPSALYTYGSVTLSATAPAGLTAPSCVTSATSSTPVGTDTGANTCSGASGSNYSVTYASGNVTVNAEPVTITASNTSMTQGSTPPTPTPEYTYGNVTLSATAPAGLAAPTCVTTATSSTPPGTDTGANTCTGASGSNYSISYVAGNVVVNPAGQTPTFTITPNPSAETVTRGVVGGFLLKLQSVDGFDANVMLGCSGGPAGSYCVDFPMTVKVNGPAYAVSGILFPKSAKAGTYVITFTGVSGSQTVKATASFTVK